MTTQIKKNIILSMKPKFVRKIHNKEKRFEYRKKIWRGECKIERIYIYATRPIKQVVGYLLYIMLQGVFIMSTKTTYAGVTTELSDDLLEAPIVRKNPPKKSNKFGTMSLYYDGVYYFPSDIKESDKRDGKPFEIQGVYYRGKWYQDTFYITNDFKEFLLNAL